MINLKQIIRQSVIRRFLGYSLQTKLLIAFLMIAFVPVGVLTYLNYRTTQAALIESANQALFAAASQTATHIDNVISSMVRIVYNEAQLPDLQAYLEFPAEQRANSALEERVAESLLAFNSHKEKFYVSSYALLDSYGKNVLDTQPSSIGQDESSQLYFQIAMKTEHPYVSPIMFPRKRGAIVFYISCPIRQYTTWPQDTYGKVLGVLRIRYNVAKFQQLILQNRGLAGEQSSAIVLDEHSLILANGEASEFLFKLVSSLETSQIEELQARSHLPQLPPDQLCVHLPSFEQGLQNAATQRSFVARTHSKSDQMKQVAVIRLTQQPWFVAFVQPRHVFLAPVKAQLRATVGLIIAITISVVALSIGISQLLTAHINKLTAVAEQLSIGNLTTEVALTTQDEIGRLGRTFNSMTNRLRQTLDELRHHRDHLEELVRERTLALEQEVVERQRAEKIANAANHAKSQFLSRMSHELRTPLNSILGYAQLLRRDQNLTDAQHDAIATIHRSGEQLLLLISDLLHLSRIEAGKIELNLGNFPLPQFLKNLVENARMRAQEKNIVLAAEIPSDLPAVVFGDESHLRQILENLLNNAIKFIEKGQVRFVVRHVAKRSDVGANEERHSADSVPDYKRFRFEVQDTGIGIPVKFLQDIFLPFHQGGNARTEGTGLGLAISQQLAHLMKSELHVESRVGQGSTFWFKIEFPIAEENPEKTLSKRSEQGHISEKKRIVGYKGRSRRILLVDDHDENRRFFKDLLFPLGFDILEASNGLEALNIVEHSPPDLVLMDLWMPGMDGFEATRRIRQHSHLQDLTVIGISASVSPQVRQESLGAGCNDFLGKPVQLDELVDCLHWYLHLEWLYENSVGREHDELPISEAFPLTLPSQEILSELLEYVENGYISDIHQSIAKMKELDPNLNSFADTIKHLADKFQFEQIAELVKSSTKGGK